MALAVLYGSQIQNLIAPKEALNASYAVLQHSINGGWRSHIQTCRSFRSGY